jgi:hypothetical protein
MMQARWTQALIALSAAEAALMLTRAETIKVCFKSKRQQTAGEKQRIARGWFREYLAEAILLVPVSVGLGILILRPFVLRWTSAEPLVVDAIVGLVSYGFPYSIFKAWAVRSAIKMLKEASSIADNTVLIDKTEEGRADAAGV